jgi:hypothetical protein
VTVTLPQFVNKPLFSSKGALMTHLPRFFNTALLKRAIFVTSIVSVASIAVVAQTNRNRPKAADEEPVFQEYRGVQIGFLADDVRKKLGTPANKGDEQDYYVFGEKERAQILYDKASKVVAISVDFSTGATEVLTPQQVFGAEIDAKPDGSMYKLVRYPKAGYWLSYSKTAGETPIVSVTITKLGSH